MVHIQVLLLHIILYYSHRPFWYGNIQILMRLRRSFFSILINRFREYSQFFWVYYVAVSLPQKTLYMHLKLTKFKVHFTTCSTPVIILIVSVVFFKNPQYKKTIHKADQDDSLGPKGFGCRLGWVRVVVASHWQMGVMANVYK